MKHVNTGLELEAGAVALYLWPPGTKRALNHVLKSAHSPTINWLRMHACLLYYEGREFDRWEWLVLLAEAFAPATVVDLVRSVTPQVLDSAWRLGREAALGPFVCAPPAKRCTLAQWSRWLEWDGFPRRSRTPSR